MTIDESTKPEESVEEKRGEKPLSAHALHESKPAIYPTPTEATGFLAVIRVRDFFFLWISQVLSQLADKFIMFTLVIVVFQRTHLASTESLLMIAFTFPSVLFSAAAGVYVDRHDKRMLMFLTNIIRAALILGILGILLTNQEVAIIPLLIVVFIFSSIGQVYSPAEAASIPALVEGEQITAATSLFMTTVILTIVAGIPLATLSAAFFGQDAPFLIAAGLFLAAGASLLGVGQHLKAVPVGIAPHPDIGKEFREGLAVIKNHPVLRMALLELSLALTVVFTVFVLGPDYLQNILHRPPNDTYLFLIPATIGMVATAVFLARRPNITRHAGTIAVFAMFVSGVVLLFLGIGPTVAHRLLHYHGDLIVPVLILAIIFGAALGSLLIPAFVSLQEQSTDEVRGRIFGGVFTIINAAIAIPLVLAGTLADHFGVGKVLGGVGLLLIIGALLGESIFHRQLHQLETEANAGSS